LNCWSVFILAIFGYNTAHGFLYILPSFAKRLFEGESIRRNRERWGNGKANRPTFHFPFLSLFSLIFIFFLSNPFYHFILFTFIFALLFVVFLTFINCWIGLQVLSIITIHWFGSIWFFDVFQHFCLRTLSKQHRSHYCYLCMFWISLWHHWLVYPWWYSFHNIVQLTYSIWFLLFLVVLLSFHRKNVFLRYFVISQYL